MSFWTWLMCRLGNDHIYGYPSGRCIVCNKPIAEEEGE